MSLGKISAIKPIRVLAPDNMKWAPGIPQIFVSAGDVLRQPEWYDLIGIFNFRAEEAWYVSRYLFQRADDFDGAEEANKKITGRLGDPVKEDCPDGQENRTDEMGSGEENEKDQKPNNPPTNPTLTDVKPTNVSSPKGFSEVGGYSGINPSCTIPSFWGATTRRPPDESKTLSKKTPGELDVFFVQTQKGNGEYGIKAGNFTPTALKSENGHIRSAMIGEILEEKYKLSPEEAKLMMKYFEKNGFPKEYVIFMNTLTALYYNNPASFEKQFGQPLYGIQNGKTIMNDSGMVLDAFIGMNTGTSENDLFIIKDGKAIINKEVLEKERFTPNNPIKKDGSIDQNLVNKFLDSKSKGLKMQETSIDASKGNVKDLCAQIKRELDSGKAVTITKGNNTRVITQVTDKGVYTVSENATKEFISFEKEIGGANRKVSYNSKGDNAGLKLNSYSIVMDNKESKK